MDAGALARTGARVLGRALSAAVGGLGLALACTLVVALWMLRFVGLVYSGAYGFWWIPEGWPAGERPPARDPRENAYQRLKRRDR